MTFADLHIHSFYSDGTMSAAEIVEEALCHQTGLIAITDHNQLAGSRELLALAKAGKIRALSGVELDAKDMGINFHILGYGIDLENAAFCTFVEQNRRRLEDVNIQLIRKMEQAGEPVSLKAYLEYDYDHRLGGWKTLHYFEACELVRDFREGFSIYARYQHDYCCADFPSVSEIVDQIHKAGGAAILAHPGKVLPQVSMTEFRQRLEGVMAMGLDGIECWYPSHSAAVTECCLAYCRSHGLRITSGSDCHGSFENTRIGQCQRQEPELDLTGLRIIPE